MAEWAPAIVTALIAIVTVIFISGQITGRIEGQEKTLVRHDDLHKKTDVRLDGHDDDIADLSVRQAKSEAWRDGYAAGRDRSEHPKRT